jgi:hypothetical protein
LNKKGFLLENAVAINHTNSFVIWWMWWILTTCLIDRIAFWAQFIFCIFSDSGIMSSQNHEQVSIWIWLSNFWTPHTSFFSDVGVLCVLFGWYWKSEKIYLFSGKRGILSSNVEINCVLCGWHWGPDHFPRPDGNVPNPMCYLRRAQTFSLFPHTRFNQWKFAYLLSRADFTPRLTLSSTLYLPPYSSLPLTFPQFRRSIVFYPATNMGDVG